MIFLRKLIWRPVAVHPCSYAAKQRSNGKQNKKKSRLHTQNKSKQIKLKRVHLACVLRCGFVRSTLDKEPDPVAVMRVLLFCLWQFYKETLKT